MPENKANAVTADEILAHPRFSEARAIHIDALVDLFKADRFVTRMMADGGAIGFRAFLVALDLSFDVADPATWGTPGNVKQWLVERGLASPRRVDDMLARFRDAGYIEPAPSPGDRRTHILAPTRRLIDHDRDHLAAYHRFLLTLFPGQGYEWVLGKDAAAHRAIRRAAFRDQPRATSAYGHVAMRLFLARDAGYLAFLLVAQAELANRKALTWSAMSDNLGVSRSHLRTLFAEAEAAGYAYLGTRLACPIEIRPLLWSAYDIFLADVQSDQHAIAQAVFSEMRLSQK